MIFLLLLDLINWKTYVCLPICFLFFSNGGQVFLKKMKGAVLTHQLHCNPSDNPAWQPVTYTAGCFLFDICLKFSDPTWWKKWVVFFLFYLIYLFSKWDVPVACQWTLPPPKKAYSLFCFVLFFDWTLTFPKCIRFKPIHLTNSTLPHVPIISILYSAGYTAVLPLKQKRSGSTFTCSRKIRPPYIQGLLFAQSRNVC